MSASKYLLLCLVICYLHANDALELAGAGRFYKKELQLPLLDVSSIETNFIDKFTSISKSMEQKYSKQIQECQNIFADPAKYFSLWTDQSESALFKLCSNNDNSGKLLKSKSKCIHNIKEYFQYYIRASVFNEINSCLDEKQPNEINSNVRIVDDLTDTSISKL